MEVCDGTCSWGPSDPPHSHLSMPDPCPHVSRMELIGAKLEGGERLSTLLEHIQLCERFGG